MNKVRKERLAGDTTPTQFQVNSSPNCLDHAGGMIDLTLLKRRS